MPEIVHWKCDFTDCGAISPLHKGMPVGWVKFTAEVPFLEPITAYYCPQHQALVQLPGDVAVPS